MVEYDQILCVECMYYGGLKEIKKIPYGFEHRDGLKKRVEFFEKRRYGCKLGHNMDEAIEKGWCRSYL